MDLRGPAGALEALLDAPKGSRFAAVVCHPHPLFGGTMHNHATYRLAKAVVSRGGVALRFNYRGVGRSAGRFDRGRGEAEDASASLAWLAREHPELPRLACGFSFGAWAAAIAGARDPGVKAFVLAGVALRAPDLLEMRHAARLRDIERPLAIVQAAGDEFASPDEIREAVAGSAGPRRVSVVKGTTHLFAGALPALQREAEAAVSWALGEAA